jgi:hypothetical protein
MFLPAVAEINQPRHQITMETVKSGKQSGVKFTWDEKNRIGPCERWQLRKTGQAPTGWRQYNGADAPAFGTIWRTRPGTGSRGTTRQKLAGG